MATYVEEFVAFLGWEVDDKELEEFNKQVDDLGGMLKAVTGIVAGAAAGLSALTAVVNETTAANVALAKSVGVSSEFLEAMGATVAPLGFEMENVVDLVEEMNNKIGESIGMGKPLSAVADATKILGLEFKTLRDLAPEDQFIEILEAAKNLENQQAAVSAVDILMGGEANKILGFLRSQDESLLELIQRQMQLNMLTERGRMGAERFNDTFVEMKTVVNSAKQEFFGLLGEALAPLLEKYADWVAENNELIKSKIAEWADRLGRAITWVMTVVSWFISRISELVDALGGMENVLKLTGITLAAVFGAKTIMAISTFIKFMRLAGTEALLMNIKAALIPATIAAIIALFILLGEDLYHFFTGGESALGKLGEIIADFVYNNIRPTIANFLGMTPEELDQMFLDALDGIAAFWDGVIHYASLGIEAIINFGSWLGDSLAKAVIQIGLFLGDFKSMGSDVIAFFGQLLNSFVAFVTSIPGQVVAYIRKSVSGIAGILSGLPIIGDVIKGGQVLVESPGAAFGGLDGLNSPAPITASPGARAAAVTNNQSRTVNRSTQMTNEFNITQQPGESGEALANRVADEIQRASARAVSANDSGIEV